MARQLQPRPWRVRGHRMPARSAETALAAALMELETPPTTGCLGLRMRRHTRITTSTPISMHAGPFLHWEDKA